MKLDAAAIVVTRGDVELGEILETLVPVFAEVIVYDNGAGEVRVRRGHARESHPSHGDLSVYGRYEAIRWTEREWIYVQDDDVVVSDPARVVRTLIGLDRPDSCVVCNMPHEFRTDTYTDDALVGFGAAFHRRLPDQAFALFTGASWPDGAEDAIADDPDWFHRTADIVFTTLTPRLLVDVPRRDLPWATAGTRMYRQPTHVGDRKRMRELAQHVRDFAWEPA